MPTKACSENNIPLYPIQESYIYHYTYIFKTLLLCVWWSKALSLPIYGMQRFAAKLCPCGLQLWAAKFCPCGLQLCAAKLCPCGLQLCVAKLCPYGWQLCAAKLCPCLQLCSFALLFVAAGLCPGDLKLALRRALYLQHWQLIEMNWQLVAMKLTSIHNRSTSK